MKLAFVGLVNPEECGLRAALDKLKTAEKPLGSSSNTNRSAGMSPLLDLLHVVNATSCSTTKGATHA